MSALTESKSKGIMDLQMG